ncbi:hypothetical protein ACFQ88_24695 [Paenibacillus sp. NPDC056579]|uniref:hypothetical protein n=1 Tax=Paenibacillus sp. NPDC056579 TaxID=3345871 RepID=UPI0036AFECD2
MPTTSQEQLARLGFAGSERTLRHAGRDERDRLGLLCNHAMHRRDIVEPVDAQRIPTRRFLFMSVSE